MAHYIFISPLIAISVAILTTVLGMPLWAVVVSFLAAGSGATLAIALVVFLVERAKESGSECHEDVSREHLTLIRF